MPALPMHVVIANRLKEKYKYSDDFMIGNLIPDITYREIDGQRKVSYSITHYSEDVGKIPSSDVHKFLFENGNNLENEVVLGTFIHILMDNYFNKYIEEFHLKEIGDTRFALLNNGRLDLDRHPMKIKHQDYEIYSNNLINNAELESISINPSVLESIKLLTYEVSEDDINYLVESINNVLNNNAEEKRELELFSKKEMDTVMEGCYSFLDSHMKRWLENGLIKEGNNNAR